MVRRLLAILLVAALTGGAASAQLRFGAKAGFTSSNASFKELDTKSVNAFHAGVVTELAIAAGFSVQSGILYQVKGVSLESEPDGILNLPKVADKKFNFVEIPLQLQWGVDLIFVRPFVLGECYWGFSTNENNTKERGYAYGAGIDVMNAQLSAKFFRNKDDIKGLQVSATFFF